MSQNQKSAHIVSIMYQANMYTETHKKVAIGTERLQEFDNKIRNLVLLVCDRL